MNPLTTVLVLQLAAAARPVSPVLSFPDPTLDDTAAYQGYRTRFFQDAARNTVQIYLDNRSGRVVNLLADAEDESIGFTVRDDRGRPAPVIWASDRATVVASSRARTLTYELQANTARASIGWFLLGSMRVERDFQYANRHTTPFASPPFLLPEMERLIAALNRLDPATRAQHVSQLNAASTEALSARLRPVVTVGARGSAWVTRVVQPSLDGRDTLALEIRVDSARVFAARAGDSITLASRTGRTIPLTVVLSTTGRALTPLAREEIFNADFLRFLAEARRDSTSPRARWLERQVRGVQLLSSREKLMAGLPAYATYFGRDMLVSALMMRSIWRDEMSEFAIASVLRKLSPRGDVSHEEALGGQAVREAANEYAALVDSALRASAGGNRAAASTLLARARDMLAQHRRVRENYHMIDDEFQLPILAARWLSDARVSAARKRAFLLDSSDGRGTRLVRLLRELALVTDMTAAYVDSPVATNLVSFARRDTGWASASWRDSNEGYAGGRFAMDVNAIWAPHALESIGMIVEAIRSLGVTPPVNASTPLGRYVRDSLALRRAIEAWRGAGRHFLVRLGPADIRARVSARLNALPAAERDYWSRLVTSTKADQDSLTFLALSLDAQGRPIGVANTDPATRLFLGDGERPAPIDSASRAGVLRDVRVFVRPYPVGLLIAGVGPIVANDAYAPPSIWPNFERDRYHGPRVVWGREVNLFLLGVANRIADASARPANRDSAYARELRAALADVQRAVEASGFHSELWSYEIANGRVNPVRYGSGSDVQLWSTTDLAVQYALWVVGGRR
jgi:hypothetical protein